MIDSRISEGLGWMSILCWLGAQFPQIIVNIQNQSVEGLALPFLANWLFGDISNLVGCILTHQLPFQTYLATYFCLVDFSLLCQYIYYYKPQPPPSTPSSPQTPSEATPLLVGSSLLEQGGVPPYDSTTTKRFSGVVAAYPPSGLLPSADELGHQHARSRSRSQVRREASTSSMPLTRTWSHRTSTQTLRELSNAAAGVALAAARRGGTYPRPGQGATTQRHDSGEGEEEDQVPAMMTESWISTISAGNTGREEYVRKRTISWDRDAVRSPSRPNIQVPHNQAQDEGSADSSTIHPEEIETQRQRSRSRGRASRPRVLSLDLTSVDSPVDIPVEELAKRTESVRSSGSRGRRSASIVFLSFGALAFFGFGSLQTKRNTITSYTSSRTVSGVILTDSTNYNNLDDISSLLEPSSSTTFLFSEPSKDTDEPPERHHKNRPPKKDQSRKRILGRIFAWTCTTLYLTSRLPQIWKNFTRKSVEGLSLALFVFAFLGNTFYVLSIMTSPILFSTPGGYASSEAAQLFLKESLPYLLGSAGTLIFDIIIVSQGLYYTRLEKELDADVEEYEDSGSEEDIIVQPPALVKDADERRPLLIGGQS